MGSSKSSIIICVITTLLSVTSVAQQKTRLGIETGINFASGTISNQTRYSSISSITAFMIGGVLTLPLSERFSLQPELYYIQRGGVGYGSFSREDFLYLDYLSIPVLVKYNFPSKNFIPHILVGPELGFNTGAEAELNTMYSHSTVNVLDNVETINFAINVGAGADVPLSENVTLVIDLRYLLGLTNIDKHSSSTIASTRDILLLSGIQFNL